MNLLKRICILETILLENFFWDPIICQEFCLMMEYKKKCNHSYIGCKFLFYSSLNTPNTALNTYW